MIVTDIQEQLSLAVLHATCAKAGFAFQPSGRIQDNWGWDAFADVKERFVGGGALVNFRLRFQVKATRQELTFANGRFSFSLEKHLHDDFRQLAGSDSPIYLVVFQMPPDEIDWLKCDHNELIIRKCLRWVSLRNAPESSNKNSVTVYIPENQVLTPDALRHLALVRSREQWLNYDAEGRSYDDLT